MSLCLPPMRAHFWIDWARRNGACSSPRKYGTNCIIPELVNIGAEGWCGMSPAAGTSRWSRAEKNSVHVRRSSSAVLTGAAMVASGYATPPTPPVLWRPLVAVPPRSAKERIGGCRSRLPPSSARRRPIGDVPAVLGSVVAELGFALAHGCPSLGCRGAEVGAEAADGAG